MFRRKPLAYSISCVIAVGTLGAVEPVLAQDQVTQEQDEANAVE